MKPLSFLQILNEKNEQIWHSPMTKATMPPENKKVKRQHKDATKNFDNTKIADRHRTVSWSNDSYPTTVVKPLYGIPTFPLTTKLCHQKEIYLRMCDIVDHDNEQAATSSMDKTLHKLLTLIVNLTFSWRCFNRALTTGMPCHPE